MSGTAIDASMGVGLSSWPDFRIGFDTPMRHTHHTVGNRVCPDQRAEVRAIDRVAISTN